MSISWHYYGDKGLEVKIQILKKNFSDFSSSNSYLFIYDFNDIEEVNYLIFSLIIYTFSMQEIIICYAIS